MGDNVAVTSLAVVRSNEPGYRVHLYKVQGRDLGGVDNFYVRAANGQPHTSFELLYTRLKGELLEKTRSVY